MNSKTPASIEFDSLKNKLNGGSETKIHLVKHEEFSHYTLWFDGDEVGVLDKILDDENYTFIETRGHGKISGDCYIAIGKILNELNG